MHAITQFIFICDLTYLNLNLHVLPDWRDDKRVQKARLNHVYVRDHPVTLPGALIGKFRKLSICQSHIVALFCDNRLASREIQL